MSELSCLHGGKRYVACDGESEATPLRKGQAYKNDIRVERQFFEKRVGFLRKNVAAKD